MKTKKAQKKQLKKKKQNAVLLLNSAVSRFPNFSSDAEKMKASIKAS